MNQLTHNELDDIFDTNGNESNYPSNIVNNVTNNSNNNNNNNSSNGLTHDRQQSDSGIGNAGVLIFDNYDEATLYRDAYESPVAQPQNVDMLQKRPSIELDLDADDDPDQNDNDNINNNKTSNNSSRGTAPNSPNDDISSPSTKDLMARDSYDEEEEEEEDTPHGGGGGGDYILTPQDKAFDGSRTTSSNKGVDTGLLNKNGPSYDDDSKDKDPTISDTSKNDHDFIELGKTGSRPSRTPTPIDDHDAEILIEKSSGCSCFGWFGKKKKNKNIGLAQQELR